MSTFVDALRQWFFTQGTTKATATSRVPLMGSDGYPAGSDKIANIIGKEEQHECETVDMGLPSGTLWAKCNIGAEVETDYGHYFSWGNLDAHAQGSGYNFVQDPVYINTNGNDITGCLTLTQDAARANWGGKWRMPTTQQFAELFNSIYTEYVDEEGNVVTVDTPSVDANARGASDKRVRYKGVVGLLLRSKVNGNLLFFPASGNYNGTTLYRSGTGGDYWSSSFYSSTNAYDLFFYNEGVFYGDNSGRRFGFTIRPVQ